MAKLFPSTDLSALIQQLPLFTNLGWWDRRLITEHSTIREYKKGEIIYNEGDPPDAFYYIISGRVQIFTHDPHGKEIILEYIRRGEYFGIISLLTGDPHSVSTKVINDVTILKIDKPDFDVILKRVPSLAMHFSHSLSRRLKRKDLHAKTIFESTIISVYSPKSELGCSWYAINLGLSLKKETGKKVILVDISPTGDVIFKILNIQGKVLSESPFMEAGIKQKIYSLANGIDILGVNNRAIDMSYIPDILSYLTNDYHYIVVDLPHEMDDVIFKALTQADLIHLLFDQTNETLANIKDLTARIEKSIKGFHERIKLCLITETAQTNSEKIETFLNYKIYATIINDAFVKKIKGPAILSEPNITYSRAIRRIAREIGGVLVGLALSSGAAFGLAHIGALKVLEEENIPIDMVVGSSMGALIAIFWASGKNAKEIEEIVMRYNTRWTYFKLFKFTFPRYGFLSGRWVVHFLHSQLGKKTFRDIRLPVKVTACDIINRKRVTIEEGNLAEAVRASISIPGIFKPVAKYGTLLIDGAIFTPVPVDILTGLGIKKIIAVSVIPSPEEIMRDRKKRAERKVSFIRKKIGQFFFPNIIDVIMNSMHIMQYNLSRINCEQADIVIRPIVPTVSWFEFFNAVALIKKGEEETRKALPEIRALLSE